MAWRTEGNGQALIYQGDGGNIRLRLGGPIFPIRNPPSGVVWAVQAIRGTDLNALLDAAFSYLQTIAIGDTWFCSAEEGALPVERLLRSSWQTWKEGHPELDWAGSFIKVN